jgi:hypothetical protein
MIVDILTILLYILLYVLFAIVMIGGSFALGGFCTALLVVTTTFPILRRLPIVRQSLFGIVESFTGDRPTSLKNKKFLLFYVGAITFYSIIFFILFAQTTSALWNGITTYEENRIMILAVAGVIVVCLLAITGSGQLRRLKSSSQSVLEWIVFVFYLSTVSTVNVTEAFLFTIRIYTNLISALIPL